MCWCNIAGVWAAGHAPTYKKKSAGLANALRLTTSRMYNGSVCANIGTLQLYMHFCSVLLFEMVIRERLSSMILLCAGIHAEHIAKV